ncbi:1-acyl-sn-glycerol-3-phosphate acyltransferase [Fulvivirga sp. RKSG066]|uniref:lysophospholipid acyltransferase family protein n=1 Tax=Fulvivirga aurantia TaxID=2529383 RepID=UPI0012BCB09E|nr:lysophospholipid acyltransferase family protein [Fulvivirga aurantia]MTI20718.1 1-acyl-sn-glycerol-3-phosphate acyltransferase [Fulvivirga aurantia]
MKIIKTIFSKLYLIWVLIVFTVFMIILLPVFILPILIGQKYGYVTYAGLRAWAWIFSQLTFIRYQIKGKENVDKDSSYIYSCNHTSFLDVPGLAISVPTQFRPLAKKELLKIPVFNLILRVATIIVDRSNPESRRESVNKLTRFLKEGISILIFPEGTQNRTKEPLQPFYDGAFRIAIETQTPIIPIVIVNAGRLMPPSKFEIKPGKIKVVFGKEISPKGMTLKNIRELKTTVYEQMEAILLKEDEILAATHGHLNK